MVKMTTVAQAGKQREQNMISLEPLLVWPTTISLHRLVEQYLEKRFHLLVIELADVLHAPQHVWQLWRKSPRLPKIAKATGNSSGDSLPR
jgi:hypothetical protein